MEEQQIITNNEVDIGYFVDKNEIKSRLNVHFKIMKYFKNEKEKEWKI